MASHHYAIMQGDTAPPITAQLLDASGDPVDITGATVRFIMARRGSSEVKVDGAATIVDAEQGTVTYSWVAADTDTHGKYSASWEATFADGSVQTFPNSRYLEIQVTRDLG